MAQKTLQEYDILQILNRAKCPYIIQCFGLKEHQEEGKRHLVLLLEYGNCTLEEILDVRTQKNISYETDEVIFIFSQLLKGFNAAKKLNISHRDIKPANIVFCSSLNQYKFIDWGEAKKIPKGKEATRFEQEGAGTVCFMAPEILVGVDVKKKRFKLKQIKYNSFETDIFSLGKTFERILWLITKTRNENHVHLENFVSQMIKTEPYERKIEKEEFTILYLSQLKRQSNPKNEEKISGFIEETKLAENIENLEEKAVQCESLFL